MRQIGAADTAEFRFLMKVHIERNFPRHFGYHGPDSIAEIIEQGIQAAARLGFLQRAGARLFIELVLLLGCEFYRDPQYPWVKAILDADAAAGKELQLKVLYAAASKYLERVLGPAGGFADAALARLERGFRFNRTGNFQAFEASLSALLGAVWPQKHAYLGSRLFRELTIVGVGDAKAYGLDTEEGVFTYVLLTLLIGAGFARDPAIAWARSVLEAKSGGANKHAALYAAGMDALRRWTSTQQG